MEELDTTEEGDPDLQNKHCHVNSRMMQNAGTKIENYITNKSLIIRDQDSVE